jgi:hypothetical protein
MRSLVSPLAPSVEERRFELPMSCDLHSRSMTNDRMTRLLASLVLRASDDHLNLSLAKCFEQHLGLRLRAKEVGVCLRRVLANLPYQWCADARELRFAPETRAAVDLRLNELAKALTRIALQPLTPRLVRNELGISGQERVRWTKDGRLPAAGHIVVQERNLRSMPVYSVDLIADISAHPERLIAWREQDATRQDQE